MSQQSNQTAELIAYALLKAAKDQGCDITKLVQSANAAINDTNPVSHDKAHQALAGNIIEAASQA